MKENGGLSGNQLPSYSDCHHPFTSLQILSDGDVRPCCWGFGAVGDLNLNSLEEIWNNEMMNQLRNDIKENNKFTFDENKNEIIDIKKYFFIILLN